MDERAERIKMLVAMYNAKVIDRQGLREGAADILKLPIDFFDIDPPPENDKPQSRFDIMDL